MSEEKEFRSPLEEGANEFGRVVEGLAGLLLGAGVLGNRMSPGETVISEDVDQAIQDLGAAVGGVLLAAGDHLQRTAGEEAEAGEEDPHDDTPLVHGARSMGKGLAGLAGDLLGSLQSATTERGAEEATTEEPSSGSSGGSGSEDSNP